MTPPHAASSGRIRAWLELARISNTPTVISNILAGAAIVSAAPALTPITLLATAAFLFYTAGMMLNDVLDADIDRAERPARPIPSGSVSRPAASMVAVLLLAAGLLICRQVSIRAFDAALALVGAILLYNVLHARTGLSVLIMGLCRGMLYILAAAALLPATDSLAAPPALPAVMLLLYTASFALVARREVAPGRGSALAAILPIIFGAGVVLSVPASLRLRFIAAVPVAVALALAARHALRRSLPPDLRRAVLGWIAGFSVIDAGVAAASGNYLLAAVCLMCFAATHLAHRRILGT